MRKLYLALALILCFSPLFSQETDSILSSDDLSEKSVLFTGIEPHKYYPFNEGSYFIYGPEFRKSMIMYRGKSYKEILINLDVFRSEVLVKKNSSTRPVAINTHQIDHIMFGDEKFVTLKYFDGIDKAKTGESNYFAFYRILHEGDDFFLKRVTKVYFERIDQNSNKSNIIKGYSDIVKYYIVKDGVLLPVSTRSDFFNCYAEIKKELKKEMKGARLKIKKKSFERDIVEVFKHIKIDESLGR